MNEVYKSMQDNQVWDLFPLSEGKKLIGCKWIFKTKRDSKGDVERYKARLIGKDFTQREGIGFTETFSLVSSKDPFKTIYLLLHILTLTYIRWMLKQPFSIVTLVKLYVWCS